MNHNTLYITKKNETYLVVKCDSSIQHELKDHFSFEVPGAKHMPKYKAGIWDGRINLYNAKTCEIYVGLYNAIIEFAEMRNYTIINDSEMFRPEEISEQEIDAFIETLNPLPEFITEIRENQLQSFSHCIRNNRATIISPTGSGKSFIIYMLARWYYAQKILIVVPTIQLVKQMKKDLISYGPYEDDDIQTISEGATRSINKRIVVSTWQSIYKLAPKWFHQFDSVIGDECHLFKAKSLKAIMENCVNSKYKFAFTGTLDDVEVNELTISGLFGPIAQFITTREMIDREEAAETEIMMLLLEHNDEDRKIVSRFKGMDKHQSEIDFIVNHKKRNDYIAKLAASLVDDVVLVTFRFEKHGLDLFNKIKDRTDRNVYFINGKVSSDERERIRQSINASRNDIFTASSGTTSVGVNITNISTIILGHPFKGRIINLQFIGRGIRLFIMADGTKKILKIVDIGDDLSYNGKDNVSLDHFRIRYNMYRKERPKVKLYRVKL